MLENIRVDETRLYRDLTVRRYDLLSEELSDFNLATGEVSTLTGGINEFALLGFFFRASYDYKSRYLIEFNGRYDGSSRFLANNRWGFFPSVSAGWRLSEEPFMKDVKKVMNNAKVRLSYGSLGNQHSRHTRGDRHPSRVEAKNPALLSRGDGYLLELTGWTKGSQAS